MRRPVVDDPDRHERTGEQRGEHVVGLDASRHGEERAPADDDLTRTGSSGRQRDDGGEHVAAGVDVRPYGRLLFDTVLEDIDGSAAGRRRADPIRRLRGLVRLDGDDDGIRFEAGVGRCDAPCGTDDLAVGIPDAQLVERGAGGDRDLVAVRRQRTGDRTTDRTRPDEDDATHRITSVCR